MTNEQLTAALIAEGFERVQTGGGLEALVRVRSGRTLMLTDSDGSSVPELSDWALGLYDADWINGDEWPEQPIDLLESDCSPLDLISAVRAFEQAEIDRDRFEHWRATGEDVASLDAAGVETGSDEDSAGRVYSCGYIARLPDGGLHLTVGNSEWIWKAEQLAIAERTLWTAHARAETECRQHTDTGRGICADCGAFL